MNLINELRERNLIQDITPETENQLQHHVTSGYVGFDPTADSLHVGNLVPITLLMRLQRAGHKPVALVGGATGMIGDPSGKSSERNLLNREVLEYNCVCIKRQLEKFLDFDASKSNCAVMVNNYDWFQNFSFLEFIRDIGKLVTVNYMMAKDSVKNRLETGMSFTEFTYQLIQGYDFYYLFEKHGVQLQMGGADQWGNIVTGTEIIRKKCNGDAFAFTCKLITKTDGSKFGKSEGGNIWLDARRTSPYRFYQFWLQQTDEDAEKLAMTFSFKAIDEIKELIITHKQAPHLRQLQKALAEEMTIMVHSKEDFEFAKLASEILFGQTAVETLKKLNEDQLLEVMDGVPKVNIPFAQIQEGLPLIGFLSDSGILASKGEAKKLVANGGVSINKEKITSGDYILNKEHLLNEKYLLVQKGKSNYTLAIFE